MWRSHLPKRLKNSSSLCVSKACRGEYERTKTKDVIVCPKRWITCDLVCVYVPSRVVKAQPIATVCGLLADTIGLVAGKQDGQHGRA